MIRLQIPFSPNGSEAVSTSSAKAAPNGSGASSRRSDAGFGTALRSAIAGRTAPAKATKTPVSRPDSGRTTQRGLPAGAGSPARLDKNSAGGVADGAKVETSQTNAAAPTGTPTSGATSTDAVEVAAGSLDTSAPSSAAEGTGAVMSGASVIQPVSAGGAMAAGFIANAGLTGGMGRPADGLGSPGDATSTVDPVTSGSSALPATSLVAPEATVVAGVAGETAASSSARAVSSRAVTARGARFAVPADAAPGASVGIAGQKASAETAAATQAGLAGVAGGAALGTVTGPAGRHGSRHAAGLVSSPGGIGVSADAASGLADATADAVAVTTGAGSASGASIPVDASTLLAPRSLRAGSADLATTGADAMSAPATTFSTALPAAQAVSQALATDASATTSSVPSTSSPAPAEPTKPTEPAGDLPGPVVADSFSGAAQTFLDGLASSVDALGATGLSSAVALDAATALGATAQGALGSIATSTADDKGTSAGVYGTAATMAATSASAATHHARANEPAAAAVPAPHLQVLHAVSPLIHRPDGSYSVRLDLTPEHLGAVQVHLQIRGGEVVVSMQAADTAARDLLRDNLDSLRQQLEQQGVRAGGLDVSDPGLGARSGAFASGEQAGSRRPSTASPSQSGAESPPAHLAPTAPRSLDPAAPLDLQL